MVNRGAKAFGLLTTLNFCIGDPERLNLAAQSLTSIEVLQIWLSLPALANDPYVPVASLNKMPICERLVELVEEALFALTVSVIPKVIEGLGFQFSPRLSIETFQRTPIRSIVVSQSREVQLRFVVGEEAIGGMLRSNELDDFAEAFHGT